MRIEEIKRKKRDVYELFYTVMLILDGNQMLLTLGPLLGAIRALLLNVSEV